VQGRSASGTAVEDMRISQHWGLESSIMVWQASLTRQQLKATCVLGCREKLSQLRTTGDAIFFRVSELQARPEALHLARQFVDLTMHSVQGWSSAKPWINATDTDSLLAEVCTCWT
jgi:hypothetical protein